MWCIVMLRFYDEDETFSLPISISLSVLLFTGHEMLSDQTLSSAFVVVVVVFYGVGQTIQASGHSMV